MSTVPPVFAAGSPDSVALPRRWLLAGAGLLACLGVAAFLGWTVGVARLAEPLDGFPRFRPPFAAGLLIAALTLWAVARGQRAIALVGGFALVVVGIGATAGIGWDPWATGSSWSRESAPALARGLILLVAGIAVLITALAPRWPALWNVVGLLAVTLLALSVMMLTARIFGLVAATDNQMSLILGAAPQMIVGAFVLGLVFARAAWRDVGVSRAPPAWVPWATGVGAVIAVVLLWRALLVRESEDLRHVVQAAASTAAARIAAPIGAALVVVNQLANRTSDPAAPGWASDSVATSPPLGVLGLVTTDSAGSIAAAVPADLWNTIDRARLETVIAGLGRATWPDRSMRDVRLGRDRFAVLVPLYAADRSTGFAGALVGLQPLLPIDIADSAQFGYRLSFGTLTVAGDDRRNESWVERADIYTSTPTVRLEVWPQPATVNRLRSNLPNIVFAFGLAVATLLPLAIQLARTAWNRGRVIERGQLYAALERGADGVWELDLVTGTIRPSRTLWQHLGYAMRELPLKHEAWRALIHPDDVARYRSALDANIAGSSSPFEVQYRFRAADGSWHWLVERGRVTERDEHGRAVRMLGIIGDVTERRQVEDARLASEQRYRATFESAFQFQALLAPDGTCLDVNRTALSYGGVTMNEVRNQPFWATPWWRSSPEHQTSLENACCSAAKGGIERLEVEAEGSDEGRVVLDLSIKPLFGSDGAVEQLLVEGRDLTERKRAEKLLREVEILATMGRVAAKVAHEINNPLAGIQNSFLLIKDAIPPSHPHIRYVGAIEREIGRISSVTRQLYETFRPDRNGFSEPPEVVIAETVSLIRQLNRNADVTIVTDLRQTLPEGVVPAAIVRQTVYNLVQNAVDASPPGGEINVSTRSVPGGYELRVRDQGAGVPAVVRDRIFDPFYTTKPNSLRPGGMGLGLYLVRRSVEALGGTVRLLVPEEGGSEFVIWFPSYRSSIAGV